MDRWVLPVPGRAEEHDVGGFVQEVELGEVGDLGGLDGALEAEVEVVDGLDLGEAGGLDARLAAVGLAGGDFLGEHGGEELAVVPAFVGGLGRERLGRRRDAGGLERPGEERDLGGDAARGGHALAASAPNATS
jgi:hypothetical protein